MAAKATGGTITDFDDTSTTLYRYKVHEFIQSISGRIFTPSSQINDIEYLIVGGGGNGGNAGPTTNTYGCGGNGGQVKTNVGGTKITINQNYSAAISIGDSSSSSLLTYATNTTITSSGGTTGQSNKTSINDCSGSEPVVSYIKSITGGNYGGTGIFGYYGGLTTNPGRGGKGGSREITLTQPTSGSPGVVILRYPVSDLLLNSINIFYVNTYIPSQTFGLDYTTIVSGTTTTLNDVITTCQTYVNASGVATAAYNTFRNQITPSASPSPSMSPSPSASNQFLTLYTLVNQATRTLTNLIIDRCVAIRNTIPAAITLTGTLANAITTAATDKITVSTAATPISTTGAATSVSSIRDTYITRVSGLLAIVSMFEFYTNTFLAGRRYLLDTDITPSIRSTSTKISTYITSPTTINTTLSGGDTYAILNNDSQTGLTDMVQLLVTKYFSTLQDWTTNKGLTFTGAPPSPALNPSPAAAMSYSDAIARRDAYIGRVSFAPSPAPAPAPSSGPSGFWPSLMSAITNHVRTRLQSAQDLFTVVTEPASRDVTIGSAGSQITVKGFGRTTRPMIVSLPPVGLTVGGIIINNGANTTSATDPNCITELGVVYSTKPGITSVPASNTPSLGKFTVTSSPLPQTGPFTISSSLEGTYFIRIYAKNSIGTSFGNELNVIFPPKPVPAYYTSNSGFLLNQPGYNETTIELKNSANIGNTTVIRSPYTGIGTGWNFAHDKDLDSNVIYKMNPSTRVLSKYVLTKGGTTASDTTITTYNNGTTDVVIGACYAPACMWTGTGYGAFIIGGYTQNAIYVLEWSSAAKTVIGTTYSVHVGSIGEVYGTEVIPRQASGFTQHFAVFYTRTTTKIGSFTVDMDTGSWENLNATTSYTSGTTGPSWSASMIYYPPGKAIFTGDLDTTTNRIGMNDLYYAFLYVWTVAQNGNALVFTYLKRVTMGGNAHFPYHLSQAAYDAIK